MEIKMMKKWTIKLLTVGLVVSPFAAIPEVAAAEEPIEVDAKAAFIIEPETNKVLFSQNPDESLGIASMTKLISTYVILDAIEQGELSWDQKVTLSDYAQNISQDYELSNVPMRFDFDYTIKDLYEAMLIYSGNGAVIAMAETLAGSEQKFVDRMIAQLDEWGIEDYDIYNSTGLPNSYANEFGQLYPGAPVDQENHMTARGVAIVADHLLNDYPEVLETTKITEKTFMEGSGDEIQMSTYNLMLPGEPYYRAGVDGLKTGTTDESGASFTGTAVEGDMRIITVLIGLENQENYAERFSETKRMMDYAFKNYEKVQIIEKDSVVESNPTIPIAKGKQEEIGLVYSEDLTVVTKKAEERTVDANLNLNSELMNEDGLIEAPIEKGTEVGKMTISIEGDDLGYLDGSKGEEVNVAVAETVEKANILTIGWRWVSGAFVSGWTTVTEFISGFF
ncbi:D-alanyl-D-alanine carboxypeptidase [Jeotgalibaca sp. MA1X17-3]|uniref:serine hydrolase n=1 Tax=Jeotgalibaca sp. MA1X17-3 TaxID=2908211 RepID=UPI001F2D3255|nr:serine hydrolase [Jeotgalibaca sp. MA1X17-3]UJF15851.1 D-alanyl-D-alanine carboxypeptidase [Jeotgalibaca sp. MA1X17-3]